MVSAYIGKGIAEGAGAVQEYDRNYEMRQLQRETARNEQALSQMKLNEYAANAPMRKTQAELELQQTQAATYQANASTLRQQTYDGFRLFQADGNARHLNNFLAQAKQNPVGTKMYGDIARYDNLVKTDKTDQLLRQAGYTDLDAVYSDPELSKDLVIVTNSAGEQRIFNMEDAYAGTGYANMMTDEQLARQEKQARINQMMRQGQSKKTASLKEQLVQTIMEDNPDMSMIEAYEMVNQAETRNRGTAEERAINQVMEDQGISYLDAMQQYYELKNAGKGENLTDQERYVQDYMQQNPDATRTEATESYRNLTQTTKQKETSSIDADKDALDEMNFFDMDVKNMPRQEQANVQRHISNIERMTGSELSNEDKRVVRNIRDLVNLGGTVADKMTPQETGLIDKTLGGLKAYVVNEVGGKEATSAYETFRNTLRNALYGASLTDTEIKAFESAAGSRNQRFKPVMQQFRTQLTSLKNQLESIRDMNDPYIAHYYLGGSVEDVDRVIEAIEDRINLVSQTEASIPKGEGTNVQRITPPEQVDNNTVPTTDGTPPKRSLTEIWEANQ